MIMAKKKITKEEFDLKVKRVRLWEDTYKFIQEL